MAAKDFAILDIQNDEDELTFQDFGDERTSSSKDSYEQTIHFNNFPDSAEDEQEQKLLESDEDQPPRPVYSFWSFEFYQQLFNVDSKQVGDRLVWSMVPKPGTNYLQSHIRPNPDLYGPFWICLTLVFTTAISGNVSNYLSIAASDTYKWKYDFHKVTFAASAIYAYAWLIPISIWGVLAWKQPKSNVTLLELLCLYGYSLAIFIPVSILWVVPQPWFRFCLAIVAPILSGSVLVKTIWPALSQDAKKLAIVLSVVIMVLHATLAFGFMLYFFNTPKPDNMQGTPNENLTVISAAPGLNTTVKEVAKKVEKSIKSEPKVDNVQENPVTRSANKPIEKSPNLLVNKLNIKNTITSNDSKTNSNSTLAVKPQVTFKSNSSSTAASKDKVSVPPDSKKSPETPLPVNKS